MRRRYPTAVALALTLALVSACSDDDEPSASGSETSAPTSDASSTDATSEAPTSEGQPEPTDGASAEPTTKLLDWHSMGKPARDTVVRSPEWTLTVPDSGAEARLVGRDREETIPAGKGRRITDAFLDGEHAVIVAQDQQEQRPQTITTIELATYTRDQVRSPRPGPGGPVAYGEGTLTYAVYRPGGRDYCLATYDVADGRGEKGYCAPPREGFSNASVSPAGVGLMIFDDTRPISCRTLVSVEGSTTTTVQGTPECTGWETLRTADGAVWSVLPNEKRVERGLFYATHDDAVTALGPGTNGTLTWCGDSAYFVRDSQKDKDKARLLRWTPDDELEVVYETQGLGDAFLAPPACADGVLTVTSYAEAGDERVWARVPD
ncbi:MAG: hypothetical protein ABWX84_03780 [Nocardioides sp.]